MAILTTAAAWRAELAWFGLAELAVEIATTMQAHRDRRAGGAHAGELVVDRQSHRK